MNPFSIRKSTPKEKEGLGQQPFQQQPRQAQDTPENKNLSDEIASQYQAAKLQSQFQAPKPPVFQQPQPVTYQHSLDELSKQMFNHLSGLQTDEERTVFTINLIADLVFKQQQDLNLLHSRLHIILSRFEDQFIDLIWRDE